MKMRDDVAVDVVDDAVRTSASQTRVTATQCTEDLFLRTQYSSLHISDSFKNVGGGGWRKWMVNTIHGSVPWVTPPRLSFMGKKRVYNVHNFSYNYFVTGEDE